MVVIPQSVIDRAMESERVRMSARALPDAPILVRRRNVDAALQKAKREAPAKAKEERERKRLETLSTARREARWAEQNLRLDAQAITWQVSKQDAENWAPRVMPQRQRSFIEAAFGIDEDGDYIDDLVLGE